MRRLSLISQIAGLLISICANQRALTENCRPEMLESMPDGMRSASFDDDLRETHVGLIEMVDNAKTSIKIASMYVYLTDPERADHPSALPGKQFLQSILEATKRGVSLEVVVDNSQRVMSNAADIETLEQVGTVYRLNMTKVSGAGILHTKFMITDDENLYLGSANFDWRAYSHVKEIGVHFEGCATMASDLDKIFQTYKLMSGQDVMSTTLPEILRSTINRRNPFDVTLDGHQFSMYLSGSPPKVHQRTTLADNGTLTESGRTDDLEALLSVINGAKEYIKVSVMNYDIRADFSYPRRYWPAIDDALRRAAIERKVRVSLLFSDWRNTREQEYIWYRSLNAIQQKEPRGPNDRYPPLGKNGGIFVRMFKVPAYDEFQANIPYSRVKHDKYVVTEDTLYVSTNNWSPEYFTNTCGVSLVFKSKDLIASGQSIIGQMNQVFDRDFSSEFARDV